MSGIAYPADAVSGSPTYAAINGRNAFSAAMAGATASKPLGGITGVRPGTPASTVTATSTTWTVQPFAGYIELEASGTNSGYFFAFGAVSTGAVTAAGGSARQDCIWVQISDSNTADGSTGAPRVDVGYTASSTTPPARAFVIAIINVPASGGGSPTVTWNAPYTAAAGGIVPSSATALTASSYSGQYIDDPARGLLRSNGTSWVAAPGGALTPVIPASATGATIGVGGVATISAAASVSINGCFTSSIDDYLVEFVVRSQSVSGGMTIRLRASGADASGTNYTNAYILQSGGASSTSQNLGTLNGSSGTRHVFSMKFYDPAIAAPTLIDVQNIDWGGSAGTSPQIGKIAIGHDLTNIYDGFTVTPTGGGTITGTIRVYQLNNN